MSFFENEMNEKMDGEKEKDQRIQLIPLRSTDLEFYLIAKYRSFSFS